MEMGTDVYVYRGWSGKKIILPGRVLSMVQETRTDRHRMEKNILQWRSFFASKRWGDGEGIFDYSSEARAILRECVHKGEPGHPGEPMWNPENHLIKFVTSFEFSDPSYHLPHFYELFALWADPCDHEFWKKAADASRKYLHTACHFRTGLSAEYADYDGTPHAQHQEIFGRHDWYYSDAYRTIANIGMDHLWLTRIPGRRKMPISCSNFTVKNRRNTGMGYF